MSSAPILQAAIKSDSQPDSSISNRNLSNFTLFACALFVVLGIVTTLLGPILPLLSVRWSIAITQAGSLFFWQFIASTLGTLVSGVVLAQRSFRFAVVIGVSLCLLGVAALVRLDWSLGRYAVACYGFGLGTALPAINLAVAEDNPGRRAASVSLLNFAWGLGAISGGVLLRLSHSLDVFLVVLSGLLVLGLIGSTICAVPDKAPPAAKETPGTPAGAWIWKLAPLIAFSMFLFVGIENAVAGWASSLALPSFSDAFTATNANIAFWTFFLAARAMAPLALRYFSEAKLLLASIVLAGIGVLAFSFAASPATILLACALAGAGIAPGFPLLISRVSELIGAQHPAGTICFSFGGLGAATLPPLVGIVGARLSQPRAGLLLPLMGLLLLIPLTQRLTEVNRFSTGS